MDIRGRNLPRKAGFALFAIAGFYIVAAYLVLPLAWSHYERQPRLADLPAVTVTKHGIPGDPLNVGLIGSKPELVLAMHAAGWFPADPFTLRTSLEIADSVILDRPYANAPVSPLFYQGRPQDLAFEKPAGRSAERRHHARFWRVLEQGAENRDVWLGAATFDERIGLSHYTGQITHHVAPDVDAERDALIGDLAGAGQLVAVYQISGIGPTLNGRNGEGDHYYTDGDITFGVIGAGTKSPGAGPEMAPNPPAVALKNSLWKRLRAWLPHEQP